MSQRNEGEFGEYITFGQSKIFIYTIFIINFLFLILGYFFNSYVVVVCLNVLFLLVIVVQLSGWASGDIKIIVSLFIPGIIFIIFSLIFRNIFSLIIGVWGIEFLISGFIEINYRIKKKKYEQEMKYFDLGKELKPVLSKDQLKKMNNRKRK